MQWCSVAQGGEPCCAALLQALWMQQFLLSLEQFSKPNSRDLCNAEDSDENTIFTKTTTTKKAIPGKARFNKVNTVNGATGLQSPVASRPVSPQRSSVKSTLLAFSWCPMGSGSAEALSSLTPWCSCGTSLVLISSLHVPFYNQPKIVLSAFTILLAVCYVKFVC